MKMRSKYPSTGSIMVSSPNLVAEHTAEPYRAQAQHQLAGDVDKGQEVFAVAPEVHRLVAEARKGREPAQDADDDERARFGGKGPARLRERRQQADNETPEDVDGQRPDRKIITPGPFLHQSAQDIAKNRPDEPADADEQHVAHADASRKGIP